MTTMTAPAPVTLNTTTTPIVHIHIVRNGVATRTLCQAPVTPARRYGNITNHAPTPATLCVWCEVLHEFEPAP